MIQITTLNSVLSKNKPKNYLYCKIAKKMLTYPLAFSLFAHQKLQGRTFSRTPFVFKIPSRNTFLQKNQLKDDFLGPSFVNRIFVRSPEKKDQVSKNNLYKRADSLKNSTKRLPRGIDYRKKRRSTSTVHPNQRKIKGRLGKLCISSTKNNTILTLMDTSGNTKGWASSGSIGFKNARKSTTYAAQGAAESMVKKTKTLGYTHLRILIKGVGRGKQSCVRALSKSQLKIVSLEDKTGIPHNGCRATKKRRV